MNEIEEMRNRLARSIKLKPEIRAALQAIAERYRVKSLTRFSEGCLAAEDRKGSEQVLFRIFED